MDQVMLQTDVLVAGGGMAGVCAAISAARNGAKVVLLQDRSVLGGNASSEIRMHIVGADCHGSRKGWRESGILEELRLEDAARNPSRCFPLWDLILYEKVVAEPNITLLLDTSIVGVEMDRGTERMARPPRTQRMYEYRGGAGRISAVRAIRPISGDEFLIAAGMFIDCTGDGMLGYEAGADFRIGRESQAMHDESLAPVEDDIHTLGSSIMFTSRKTDHPVTFVAPSWVRKFDPEQLKVGRSITSWEYGFWWIEWGGTLDTIKDNCTDIRHELYRIALGLWDYVKNSGRFPESANWTLDWIGAIPGKRESRRFVGPHMLTQNDLQSGASFADDIAYGGWPIDTHPVRGIDQVDEMPCHHAWLAKPYGVPLRCCFSRNIENLFFAGRNISATYIAFASTRVMGTCAAAGQAVGAAAAQCVKERSTPADIVRSEAQLGQLQQALAWDDASLLRSHLPADGAGVSASSHQPGCEPVHVLDGFTRDELHPQTGELITSHGWRSLPLAGRPQWIELSFDRPRILSQVHLWFDSGFERELMLTPSDACAAKSIRAAQPEIVRDYSILADGQVLQRVSGNYLRKCVHRLSKPIQCRSLRLEISATQGAPEARVLEFRAR